MVNAAKMYKECQWKAVGRASTITLELLYSGHPSNSFLIKGGVLISEVLFVHVSMYIHVHVAGTTDGVLIKVDVLIFCL